ncbi:hypothetical protein H8E88_00025 [candidate division KSB1 bacterium]|nr:hypothetical protein [candidate division KSB1 bacterium]
MKKIFLSIVFIFTFQSSQSFTKQKLYVSVLQTNNYVVGAKNAPSGLYRFESDTLWTHLGWKNVRNFGLTADPKNNDIIFLACGNGVLHTIDRGKTWKVTTGWQVTEVLDVTIDPFNNGQIYIATAYGVWRSTDRGKTWHSSSEGLNHKFVQTIVTDRRAKYRLMIGGESGLFVSENRGKNWRHIVPIDVPIRDIHQNFKSPKIWMAGTEDHGVLLSRDFGNTWQYAEGEISSETIYAVASDPQNSKNMAAGGFQTGVYVSTNGGKKWKKYVEGLPVIDIHALSFDPQKKGRIWAGTVGAGVYYSDNFGKTWNYAGLNGAEIWDMIFIGD